MAPDADRRAVYDSGRIRCRRLTPAGLEQFKLDRLLELRAVIDSLRAERGAGLLTDVRPLRALPLLAGAPERSRRVCPNPVDCPRRTRCDNTRPLAQRR